MFERYQFKQKIDQVPVKGTIVIIPISNLKLCLCSLEGPHQMMSSLQSAISKTRSFKLQSYQRSRSTRRIPSEDSDGVSRRGNNNEAATWQSPESLPLRPPTAEKPGGLLHLPTSWRAASSVHVTLGGLT